MNYVEKRPWGKFENLLDVEYCKVKRITIDPLQRISYQYHSKRKEAWTVVKGRGVVTLNGSAISVVKGDTVTIPFETKHRIENIDNEDELIFIEVQSGTYFGEDDIVRLSDDYNRN